MAASEDAASSVGINVPRIKLEIFVLGAAYAGMAGSLFACVMSIANPEAFSLGLTVLIVMMVILGGMGIFTVLWLEQSSSPGLWIS